MSASTIKPVPTLKGMFSEPKMNHRRNFLKENKLSLREKPSTGGGKDEDKHKVQSTSRAYERKRSASRGRSDSVEPRHNGLSKQPSSSSIRGAGQQTSQRGGSSCSSCDCGNNKLASKPSAHKGIQTDDIHDEKYLYDALKKCTSYETKTLMSNRSNFAHNNYSEQNLALTPRSDSGQQLQDYYLDEQQAADGGQSGGGDADALSMSKQSMASGKTNHHYAQHGSIGTYHSQLSSGMQQMALNDAYGNDPPVSGRSNKSNGSRHQLGSRDNLRLPNYLEKEKLEKAAERQRQNDVDPECPPGHFLLNEEERQTALKDTQAKFDTLINEINRMPVTSTTMRVRNRRNEIEKELLVLESDLRALGKSKVYIKNDEPQQDYNQ